MKKGEKYMNLKESYRYANYLDRLMDTAYEHLSNRRFITTTTQNHLRSKANAEVQDETLEVPKPYDVDFSPNDIIDFVVKVIDEKEALASAIATAKAKTEINIDNSVAMNKKKQSFVRLLNGMAGIKPGEKIVSGSDYKFNAEGNQVKYFYDVVEKTSIDFDRNDVRNLAKKYLQETDEISSKLDSIEISTEVVFTPSFDINDSFEDIVVSK